MNRFLSIILSAACLWVTPAPAQDSAPVLPDEPAISPAAQQALTQAGALLGTLTSLLEQVQDAAAATRLAPEIIAAQESLAQLDFSDYDIEDVELLAEEFSALYFRLEEQLTRLDAADYYGNAELSRHFGGAEEPATQAAEPAPAPEVGAEQPAAEAVTESVLP